MIVIVLIKIRIIIRIIIRIMIRIMIRIKEMHHVTSYFIISDNIMLNVTSSQIVVYCINHMILNNIR